MDVTGTVGGQSMTPYQSQEIAPSHLGAVTQDFSEDSAHHYQTLALIIPMTHIQIKEL